jgi:short-subunit dehydrogenase
MVVELRGARALVTGAGGGLGGYISRALARQGANLVVSDLPGSAIEAHAEALARLGVEAKAVPADLTDSGERERLAREAEAAIGPLDVLVNNAGLEYGGGFLVHTTEELEAIVEVNLLAVMELTRLALPGMLERGRGHVVNVASAAGKAASAYLASYSATKHAVVGFTHSLRGEFTDEPVGFSAICPIFISRVGMYGRLEGQVGDPPWMLRTKPPEAVGAAVVKAIRDDRAEVIVGPPPLRVLAAFYAAAPKTALRVLSTRRSREFSERFARARGRL